MYMCVYNKYLCSYSIAHKRIQGGCAQRTLDWCNYEYVTDEGVASILAACPVLKVSPRAKSLQIHYRNAGEMMTNLEIHTIQKKRYLSRKMSSAHADLGTCEYTDSWPPSFCMFGP